MFLLKLVVKIILLLIMLALTLIHWTGIFLNSISEVLFGILAFIFTLTGIASLLFGLLSEPGALKIIIVGFVIFMIPVIGEWVLTMIESLRIAVRNYIRAL